MSLQFFRGRAAQGGSFTGLRDMPGQASVVSFGAAGDGSTDDSAAITAAINEINAQGGGTVYFPPGNYVAQGLPVYENIFYRGAGTAASKITLASSPTDDLFIGAKTGAFTNGGMVDLSLDGVSPSRNKDGLTFSGVTGALNRYYLNRVEFKNFRYGYAGPTTSGSNPLGGSQQNEFETYVEQCSFVNCAGAGMRTYENPFVVNCRFNGNGTAGASGAGILGRLSDAFIIGCSFSQLDWAVKAETANAHINTIFQGNLMLGQTLLVGGYCLGIDIGCIVTGNMFLGTGLYSASQAPERAILVRGPNNIITGNKFGRPTSGLKAGFSVAAIDFSPTDWTGANIDPVGMACVIEGNHFINDEGPCILFTDGATPAKKFEGCSIRGNTFHVSSGNGGFRCIQLLNAQNGGNVPFTRGNTISDNTFVINKNGYNLPALEITYSYYGNQISGNNFYFGGGTATNTPIMKVDARESLITGNRVHQSPSGGSPGFNFTAKNSLSRIYGNQVGTNGGEQSPPEMNFNETRVLGKLIGANFNVTTDQAIAINSTRYIVERVMVCAPSISLTAAAGGFYTAASKGGTAIVAAAQAYSALTGATKWLDCTLTAGPASDTYTGGTLYLSLTTAQGAAATADVYIIGRDIGKS